jgi:SAM-dependent methyltransferase
MFNGSYSERTQKKIKAIIDHYGHTFFVHKKLLDLGCGHGDIGGVFHRLGSEVTAVDARQDHLKMVGKKYAGVKTVKADLDGAWPFFGKHFDLVLDLGLTCHLSNLENHLKAVCASTTYLVLETAVADSSDPNYIHMGQGSMDADASYNGVSCQASPAYIERILRNCGMVFKRMDSSKLNCGAYVYDWRPANNNSYDLHHRRMWFCVNERNQIKNPNSSTPLPISTLQPIFPTSSSPPGVFPTHLTDSKVHLVHQRVVTTKSPSPPVADQRGYTTSTIISSPVTSPKPPVSNTFKTRLFFNYYEDPSPARRQEIDLCLQKNLDNPLFDIIIIDSENSPTFDFLFEKINLLVKDNDVSIICNSDIFFDDSIRLSSRIKNKEIYALSSWDYVKDNHSTFSNSNFKQDAWIVQGKINNIQGNFPLGKPGAAARIAYQFKEAGYTVFNPSLSIKAFHVHQSGIRHYSEQDRIHGQYLYVDPTSI